MNISFDNQLGRGSGGDGNRSITADLYLQILNKIYAQIRYDCYQNIQSMVA